MSRLDWEQAKRRDSVRTPPPERPVVAWWLVPSRGCCDDCGERCGGEAGYNHSLVKRLCRVCMERQGISAQPSKRLLAARKRQEAPPRKGKKRRKPHRLPADVKVTDRDDLIAEVLRLADEVGGCVFTPERLSNRDLVGIRLGFEARLRQQATQQLRT